MIQTFRFDVWSREGDESKMTRNRWVQTAHHAGFHALTGCFDARVFFLDGELNDEQARRIGESLLADPVTETCSVSVDEVAEAPVTCDHSIEVTLLPGVTDSAADNLRHALKLMGIDGVTRVATGQRYLLRGHLDDGTLHELANRVFSNPVIQRFEVDQPIAPPFVAYHRGDGTVEVIPLRDADDAELLRISADRRLALQLHEMQAIRHYYQQEARDPSDVELEMLAQTWSEHCVHKTFRAPIHYRGPEPGEAAESPPVTQEIPGLLRTYIRAATEKIDKPWVRSAFVDNAGIIAFDDACDAAFKVETHNHPSAIEPFGGANTGVGGVVRDILGVSARPIANTDVLCFGPQDLPEDRLPEGALHPRRIAEGVIHGVEDYGNKMGIPTVNGAILYDAGYTANPLVFCGCLGLLPRGAHPTGARPGDVIVVIGGRTGRDGLRGATFSSMEMDRTQGEIVGSVVQIGNPIQEKQVQEVILRARDARLYSAVTDCGAGGLSSAVGEMGKETGARVQLDRVPLKYPGLRPWEIWLSEAQERMVLAVPPQHIDALQTICDGQDVEMVCIGTFDGSGRLTLYDGDRLVGAMAMDFLHDGLPIKPLEAVWTPSPQVQLSSDTYEAHDLRESLLALLAHPNIRSKEAVVRRYDHEVQGGTVIKPFVGADNHGPGDGAVLVPLDTQHAAQGEHYPKGLAVSSGICPQYSAIDPYAMAWAAVDEALRNAVAVGADPGQIAILDNFCWGNPNLPDRLGSLVRCVQGCHDAALAFGTPFVSGKDSLNNEYTDGNGQRHTIPGTLLISALGIVPDTRRTATMDLKRPGDHLYLIGDTRAELGGSHYHLIHELDGGIVPQPNANAIDLMRALHNALRAGLVRACHDVSEGGVAVALAEMCLAGRVGAAIDLSGQAQVEAVGLTTFLFSESLSRFVVEVAPEDDEFFRRAFDGRPLVRIGEVSADGCLRVSGYGAQFEAEVSTLERAWRGQVTTADKGETAVPARDTSPGHWQKPTRTGPPRVLILHANGTNRDHEAALACAQAGGQPEIVHINQLLHGERHLLDYHMLVIPGGFSYGDDLGAGVLWSLDLRARLDESMNRFVDSGRPVLGICNGFQALVKAGVLPGDIGAADHQRTVTLTFNEAGRFECRWVYLKPNPASLFTDGLDDLIYCPVAHGEGRIAARDPQALQALRDDGLVTLTYVDAEGRSAAYPGNPNGSAGGIAALSNRAGNVMGLMPHPEDHIFPWQHPRWQRGEQGQSGLRLFQNGIKFA